MKLIVVFSRALIIVILTLTFMSDSSCAQQRPPHGLAYENPVAFSPSAYDFFHPDAVQPGNTKNSCSKSGCSPMPLAAHFESNQAHESNASWSLRHGGLGAGSIATIVSGFVFAALLEMGAYFVATTRGVNIGRAISDQPDV